VPFVRLATIFWMDEPLASETPSIEEPSAESQRRSYWRGRLPCGRLLRDSGITAASDWDRNPRDEGESPAVALFSALEDWHCRYFFGRYCCDGADTVRGLRL